MLHINNRLYHQTLSDADHLSVIIWVSASYGSLPHGGNGVVTSSEQRLDESETTVTVCCCCSCMAYLIDMVCDDIFGVLDS